MLILEQTGLLGLSHSLAFVRKKLTSLRGDDRWWIIEDELEHDWNQWECLSLVVILFWLILTRPSFDDVSI